MTFGCVVIIDETTSVGDLRGIVLWRSFKVQVEWIFESYTGCCVSCKTDASEVMMLVTYFENHLPGYVIGLHMLLWCFDEGLSCGTAGVPGGKLRIRFDFRGGLLHISHFHNMGGAFCATTFL